MPPNSPHAWHGEIIISWVRGQPGLGSSSAQTILGLVAVAVIVLL